MSRPIDRDSGDEANDLDIAELLVMAERLWRTARHPMGDIAYQHLRPQLERRRAELKAEPHPTLIQLHWLSEINKYLPKDHP